jgi:type I restriction enzyme M protein
MPKLSLAKLERHLYSAADRLRQEGLEAATYKDYICGMLFLKRCSDVFAAKRENIVGRKIEQGMVKEAATRIQTHAIEHFGLHKRAVPRRSRFLWE